MVSNVECFDFIGPIPGRYPVDYLEFRERRLRDHQFAYVGHSDEFCPFPKPAAWAALEAVQAAEDADRVASDAWAEARSAARELAGGIVSELGYEPCEDFRVEIEPEAPYAPAVWLHGDYAKIRVPLENFGLAELARVATFLDCLPYWGSTVAHDPAGRPSDSWDVAVPYHKAEGTAETHILLYDTANSRCVGHLPAAGTRAEALAQAQRLWDEVEASWQIVTPAYPRSPWSADSAESPETPDTPMSAGSAE